MCNYKRVFYTALLKKTIRVNACINPSLFSRCLQSNSIRNRTNLTLAIQRVFVTLSQYMHIFLKDNANGQKPESIAKTFAKYLGHAHDSTEHILF